MYLWSLLQAENSYSTEHKNIENYE